MRESIRKIIACPKCKGNLILNKEGSELRCRRCRMHFKIKQEQEGFAIKKIPCLLLDK